MAVDEKPPQPSVRTRGHIDLHARSTARYASTWRLGVVQGGVGYGKLSASPQVLTKGKGHDPGQGKGKGVRTGNINGWRNADPLMRGPMRQALVRLGARGAIPQFWRR